jgi:nitronate monooxygenase
MKPTELTRLLGIEHPLIQAPMAGGPTTAELVAAVSGAGAFGVLAGTGLPLDVLESMISATQTLTRAPFGVNFLLVEPGSGGDIEAVQSELDPLRAELGLPPGPRQVEALDTPVDEQVTLCLELGVKVLTFALDDPSRYVGRGALVGAMVSTAAEGMQVADAGVDFVIAQGAEAGGHRSTFDLSAGAPLVGTLALVPQVVDAVAVPVVATGGIADGRGLAAALALGAAGAQVGTRFLLAREAATPPAYRQALARAIETDTVVTRQFTGRPARSIRNRVTETAFEPLPWPLQRTAAADLYQAAFEQGKPELHPLFAGQNVRGVSEEQPAAAIVAAIVEEAERVLASLTVDS